MGYLLSSLYGRTQILNEAGHARLCDSLPCLFEQQYLADSFQAAHLVDERFHHDDRDNRVEDLVVGDVIQLEDNEPLREQVELLVRIEQVVILSAPVKRLQNIQKILDVEIFLADFLLNKPVPVIRIDEFVKVLNDGVIEELPLIFARYRLTALDSATSSARVGSSVSRFQRATISVLIDSRFSMS